MARTQAKRTRKVSNKQAKNYATPALEKGLDVLELLAHEAGGLTKTEVARKLGRTVSEIFRMLVCLEHRGYLTRSADDRYTLTLKLFQLVQEHPPTERLIAEALPVMHRLAQQMRQSCHLAVIEGGQVVILAQVNSPGSVGFYVKLGSSVELMEAASAYVILAHQTPEHMERNLEEWRRKSGLQVPREFRKHLTKTRETGYEMRASYQVHGVTNISFPVFDHNQEAVAALTVPYLERKDETLSAVQVVPILQAAAAEISKAIGGKLHIEH